MYLGLLLLPWVLLYGVSAFLFNHPGAFAERESSGFSASFLQGSALARPADAELLARDVVEALRTHLAARPDEQHLPDLGEPHAAQLSGDLFYSFRDSERSHLLRVDLRARGAVLLTTPRAPEPDPSPIDVEKGLRVARDPFERGKAELAPRLAELGFAVEHGAFRAAPELHFQLEVDGEPWRASYDFEEGSLRAERAMEPPAGLPARQALTRLHVAHGYTSWFGAETLWALFVDTMAVAMVTWALTGLVMWWQIRRTRMPGGLLIAGSLVLASALGWGMLAIVS
jgi:hypothetical protein